MFYISRRKGHKYGVVDTSDNIEEFYFAREIEEIYNKGVQIKGVSYFRGNFVITPQSIVSDKKVAAKNKLTKGSSTGIVGFNVAFHPDGTVEALPLTIEFFKNAPRLARNNHYILEVPEPVNKLSARFFNSCCNLEYTYKIKFTLVLPKTLKIIGAGALYGWVLSNVVFNDCVLSEIQGDYRSTSYVGYGLDDSLTLRVKKLARDSLAIRNSIKYLYLPDIELLEGSCLNYIGFRNCLSVLLGSHISYLPSFMQGVYSYEIDSERKLGIYLMNNATIVYIDDNSELKSIDLSDGIFNSDNLISYIFVMSESYYNTRFKRIFKSSRNGKSYAGVLLYNSNEQYEWYINNLSYCCKHVTRNFKKYLNKDSCGTYTVLELKYNI